MKWEHQTHNACLAYAMWSVGQITKEERDHYAQEVAPNLSFREQLEWTQRHAPALAGALVEVNGYASPYFTAGTPTAVIPQKGTGVVLTRVIETDEAVNGHAMAYHSGMVLDPAGPGRLETWEGLRMRYKAAGRTITFKRAVPTQRKRKA